MPKHIKIFSIRKKLILFFLFLILMMTAVSYTVYINFFYTTNSFIVLVRNLIVLNNITKDISSTQKNLEDYLTFNKGENLDKYNASYDKLYEDIESFSLSFSSSDDYMIFQDIKGMIISFKEKADEAIWATRGRDAAKSLMYFEEAKKISVFMETQIKFLVLNHLSRSEEIYLGLIKNMGNIQTIIVFFIISTALIIIIFAIVFSRGITKPILDLTESAKQVSKGYFDIDKIETEANDEISILAAAFNKMTSNIKSLIEEIKEKASIQEKLQQKEMENLEISHLLKETQLKALQSQINPHFLFNTLNCISQTALIEEADNTCRLIESVSDLLRYNLQKIDKSVTLGDEIRNLHAYIYIQKARYRNRMKFSLKIQDEKLLKISMPSLTIQPIVENAFIHGIEKCEKAGEITINILSSEGKVLIEIKDTGIGMEKEKIKKIFDDEEIKSDTNGIGLRNVLRRLRLFYNEKDVMTIESIKYVGTNVILKLPHKGGDNSVQTNDC